MFETMRPGYIALLLMMAGCTNGAAGVDVAANEEALRKPQLEWTTFEDPEGTDAAGSKPVTRLIQTEAAYRRLFGHHSPDIDFHENVVVFYSAGVKNTGGYSADIASVERHAQHLTVTTQLTVPGADCVVTQALTTPSVLARVHVRHVLNARFEHSEQVEDCEPATPCGGFAGIQCPGLGLCVDNPADNCDPDAGGADCGGICTCDALAKCQSDYIFDRSPEVCACVKAVEDPCATVDCRSGAVCTVSEGKPICVSNGNWQCGKNLCPAGEQCCNESCGICAEPNGACPDIACLP